MTSEKRFTPSLREVFLVEDSRGNIVRLLKLPRDVADVFHVADPKHAFTLAKVFKADLSYNNQNAWEAREWFEDAYGRSLLDFLRKHPQSAKDFEKIEPGHEVYLVVRDIVKRAVSGKDVSQLKARAEIKFPDGFFWMKLDPEECRAEGDAMGHCGQDDRGDLWSLRDKQGKPHVTMTYAPEKKTVFQIKGKQNAIPDKRYWDYILSFFKKFGAHVSDREVRLSDLGEKLREFEKVPTWEVVLDMVRNEEWDSKKIDRRVPMINVSGKLNGIPWEVTWAEQSEDYPGYFGMTIGDDTPIHFGEMEFNADELELVHDANEVLWKTLRYG
jgi:hypothetical protein